MNRSTALPLILAPLALALASVTAQPAIGQDDTPPAAAAKPEAKCKLAALARLPVVMEGVRASVPVTINGNQTRFWLDSGAFFSTMSQAKADELGLRTHPAPIGFYVNGIGGSFQPGIATVKSFGLVGNDLHNVDFIVGGSDPGNGFIGLNLLAIGDTEYDLAHGAVNLFVAHGCAHSNFAYWAGDKYVAIARLLDGESDHDRHIYGDILVNGHKLRATFDTGASTTILTRRAAIAAGIDMTAPSVVASHAMSGFGPAQRHSWIVHADTVNIGGEEIRNTPIRVIDESGRQGFGYDVLLGADFFLSHHVFVSRSERLIFITYNGGPVFSISTEHELGHLETRAENLPGTDTVAEPTTADGFAGRGSARLTRGDMAGAIADLTAAIGLAPTRSDLLRDRAQAYARAGKPAEARADFDAALKLAPNDPELLLARGHSRLNAGDHAGALADADAAAAAMPKGSLRMVAVINFYERLREPARALALVGPVIALHQDDSQYPALLNSRCWLRGLANVELDGALDDCNRALRKAGQSPSIIDSRALVELRRKDYAAAIADYDKVLAGPHPGAGPYYLRGLARIASGQREAGEADIAEARKREPEIAGRFAAYGLGV